MDIWAEYDSAAAYLAKRGMLGIAGDALPDGLSVSCQRLIDDDPEAFEQRVKETGYAIAMGNLNILED